MLKQILIDNVLITCDGTCSFGRYPRITTRCISENEHEITHHKFTRISFGSVDQDHDIISKIINFDLSIDQILGLQKNKN
jgi:hypothetical protein